MGIHEPEIDPNTNFNAALQRARQAQQQRRVDADEVQREDLGEPTEAAGTGSRRPLAEQISEEAGAQPQPREPETQQFMSPDDPLARFGSSPRTHALPDPGTIEPPDEPETPPAAAETPQEREARLLAGRFPDTPEGREQLAQSYQELERQQGQSSGEMNTLRATVEDLQRRIYAQQPPTAIATPQAPQTPMSQEQIENGLARSGREFLAQLYEAEHPSYEDALAVGLAVNPVLVMRWTSEVSAWETEQRLRDELAQRDQTIQELSRNESVRSGSSVWNQAWTDVATASPEANVLAESMMKDLQANPWLAAPMKEGVEGAEKLVIENLLVRARDANRPLVDEAKRLQAEEDGKLKRQAYVASGSGSAAPVAGETGSVQEESKGRVDRLKASILNNSQGQNVHDAIHGAPRT